MLSQKIDCSQRFQSRHVAGAGHHHVRFGALIRAGPGPDAYAGAAVCDGGVHVKPLQLRLFAGHNHVHIVTAA